MEQNYLNIFNAYYKKFTPKTACLLPKEAENSQDYINNLSEDNLQKVPIADIDTNNLIEVDEHPNGLFVEDDRNKYFVLD